MTALALRALTFAERYGITIAVVASDRLSWQSQGPTPGWALKALKAAKGELIDLLVRYRLDSAGGLAGDDLLAALRVKGFAARTESGQLRIVSIASRSAPSSARSTAYLPLQDARFSNRTRPPARKVCGSP